MANTYQILTTATLIQPFGLDESLLIYNPSTNANTVYADSQQGVNANSGVPIAPGTSIVWAAGKPLYLISPNGVESVTIAEEANNMTNATDVANALLASGLANSIAQQIALNGAPSIDAPASFNAFNVLYDVTKFSSIDFKFQPASPGLVGINQKDIWALQVVWRDIYNNNIAIDFITGHSDSIAYVTLPTRGTHVTFQWSMIVNTSGTIYTSNYFAGEMSYRVREPEVIIYNAYWENNYGRNFQFDVEPAYGDITLTNTSISAWPSYRRGNHSVGLLLNNLGTTGATSEFALQDAFSGIWLDGYISQPATVATFTKFVDVNFRQQPSIFLKTTSTTAQTYRYSQTISHT